MPTKSKFLAANLRRAREARGLSTAKMADFLGINTSQTYRNYEEGRVPRDKKTLQQIANKLATDPDSLISTILSDEPLYLIEGPTTEVNEHQHGFNSKPMTIEDRLHNIEAKLDQALAYISELRKDVE